MVNILDKIKLSIPLKYGAQEKKLSVLGHPINFKGNSYAKTVSKILNGRFSNKN